MKRIITGFQATGRLHIGNYLGAMLPAVQWQEKGEAYYFIPNMHSLNVRPDAKTLRRETLENVAWLLAIGIDPKQSVIFAQSQVPAHSELFNILNNYVTMGELSRMTQYKDKVTRFGDKGQLVGLYEYPVLMAADILLYGAEVVPVGEDQKQHVELARDIAERFNNLHGPVFILPKAVLSSYGERVMSLQNPDKKMSKSDPDINGKLELLDDEAAIKRKISKAVTDSGSTIQATEDKPALTNLLQIFAAFSGQSIAKIEGQYVEKSYAEFKADLAELIVDNLLPMAARYHEIAQDEQKLLDILEAGKAKAEAVANAKLEEVKTKLGLL